MALLIPKKAWQTLAMTGTPILMIDPLPPLLACVNVCVCESDRCTGREKRKERQSTYVLDNLERDRTEKGKVSFDFRRGELMKFHRSSSR